MFRIRKYNQSDREGVVMLLRRNTPAYFDPSEESDLQEYLDLHSEHYFVVEKDGVIVGSGGVNCLNDGKFARMSWDLVDPDHHRRGIGKAITEH